MAKATGAPVYCPKLEVPVLADIMAWVPWPGIGPFESYDADETLEGGEKLELAGLRDRRAVHPGPLARARRPTRSRPSGVILSGDVLFQGSIGRTDLPGGDHQRLLQSIGELLEALPDETARAPRPHGADDARRRARHQPVPARTLGVSEKIQAPRGTFDVLGDDALARDRLEATARGILEPAGYARIETPMFEATALFARGVGESTDVVQKEMYTFDSGDGRSR